MDVVLNFCLKGIYVNMYIILVLRLVVPLARVHFEHHFALLQAIANNGTTGHAPRVGLSLKNL